MERRIIAVPNVQFSLGESITGEVVFPLFGDSYIISNGKKYAFSMKIFLRSHYLEFLDITIERFYGGIPGAVSVVSHDNEIDKVFSIGIASVIYEIVGSYRH
jgi:hypothetical protein